MEKYLLHINKPCTQNWESMTTAEQGKFCNQCNKTVFDFTTATDAEIVKHIEAMKGELFCGRFEDNQLDRWIERSDIKRHNPRLYKFLISFMLMGAAQGTNAQVSPAQEKVASQKRLDSLLNLETTKAEMGEMVCDTVKPNGVVVQNYKPVLMGMVGILPPKTEPLIIVNGQLIKKASLSKLDPNKIKNLTVLKSADSQALYGSQGINGAIIITSSYTKKELRRYNK